MDPPPGTRPRWASERPKLALLDAIRNLQDRRQIARVDYTVLLCDTEATNLGAETVGERKQRRSSDLAEAMLAFQKGHRIEGGDPHVHFLDGSSLLGPDAHECTVDGIHPNDLGFMHMARNFESVFRELIDRG